MNPKETGTITVYAAGGCGINIASQLEDKAMREPPIGFSSITPIYIDTSRSNLKTISASERTYLIEDPDVERDGSGKVRSENHVPIGECVFDILLKHKPGDLAVVISSASGGSGSIIASSLVAELLHRKQMVIVVTISSTDSRIEVENNIKTIKTYEHLAQTHNTPVAMVYLENEQGKRRSETDKSALDILLKLSVLFSRQNSELDRMDLRNWLNYTKTTDYDPHLVLLRDFPSKVVQADNQQVLSVATVAMLNSDTSPGQVVEYQCVGFLPKESENITLTNPLHFALVDGAIPSIVKEFQTILNGLEESKRATVRRPSILSSSDKPTANGTFL